MPKTIPAVFVSHGSPMLVLDESAVHHFLKGMSDLVPTPKDILVVSAHWETEAPRVSLAKEPETIYDFGGFPRALYEVTYPAPGARTSRAGRRSAWSKPGLKSSAIRHAVSIMAPGCR